jgi:hypothetical protein
MRRTSIIIIAIALSLTAIRAWAWCESDCTGLCNATGGRGAGGTVQACTQKFQCQQYAGRKCEPEKMRARVIKASAVTSARVKRDPLSYRDCVSRGVSGRNTDHRAFSLPETQAWCRSHGYNKP